MVFDCESPNLLSSRGASGRDNGSLPVLCFRKVSCSKGERCRGSLADLKDSTGATVPASCIPKAPVSSTRAIWHSGVALNFPEKHGFPRSEPAPPDSITAEALRTKYAAEQFQRTCKEQGRVKGEQGSQDLPALQFLPEWCVLCLPTDCSAALLHM